MKLNQFSNLAQPRIAVFKELHDKYNGVIVDGPQWITDPLDSAKELLRTVIQDDRGLYWAFMARTQMPDAIYDAVVAAGVDEIEVGGQPRNRVGRNTWQHQGLRRHVHPTGADQGHVLNDRHQEIVAWPR